MARELNFNNLTRPHLKLTMRNGDVLRVTTPSEEMVRKLSSSLDELMEIFKGKNQDSVEAAWQLFADLFSFNLEGVKVTPEDLRGKYGLYLEDLLTVCPAYIEFIEEIANAKN